MAGAQRVASAMAITESYRDQHCGSSCTVTTREDESLRELIMGIATSMQSLEKGFTSLQQQVSHQAHVTDNIRARLNTGGATLGEGSTSSCRESSFDGGADGEVTPDVRSNPPRLKKRLSKMSTAANLYQIPSRAAQSEAGDMNGKAPREPRALSLQKSFKNARSQLTCVKSQAQVAPEQARPSVETMSEKQGATHLQPWRFQADSVRAGVLNPDGRFRVAWDLLMAFLLVYLSVAVPLELGYSPKTPLWLQVVNVTLDVLFIIDIFLSFVTGYVQHMSYIYDRKLVAQNYLRTWFVPDVVSSIPVQIIFLSLGDESEDASGLMVLKLIRLFKLGRLSRFGRLKLFKDIENSGYFRPGAVRLVKFSFAYLLVMHILASFYWFVAASGINVEECNDQGGKSQLGAAWGVCDDLVGASLTAQWAHSVHWVLLATIGENMGANQPWQHAFSIFMIVIGHLINACIVGSCASLLLNLDHNAVIRQQQKEVINGTLRYHKVPYQLARRIRTFYEYLWEWGQSRSKDGDVFRDLPLKLSHQLSIVKHNTLVESLAIFREVPNECVVAMIQRLSNRLVIPRDYVIIQNQKGRELFLIGRGRVQVTRLDDKLEEVPMGQIAEGSVFGEMAMLNTSGRRTANVLTLVFCEFHVLNRHAFDEITAEHPELRAALEDIMRSRMEEAKKLEAQRAFGERFLQSLVGTHALSPERADARSPSPAAPAPAAAASAGPGKLKRANTSCIIASLEQSSTLEACNSAAG